LKTKATLDKRLVCWNWTVRQTDKDRWTLDREAGRMDRWISWWTKRWAGRQAEWKD